MNKTFRFCGAIALILALSLPMTIHAQDAYISSSDADQKAALTKDAGQNSSIQNTIRQKMRSVEDKYQVGLQNVRSNQEGRNLILRSIKAPKKNQIMIVPPTITSDTVQPPKESVPVTSSGMRHDNLFKTHRTGVVSELSTAISKLKQVGERVVSRIQKDEQGGKDMTATRNLMLIFGQKIADAEQSISVFSATSTDASSGMTADDIAVLKQNYEISVKAVDVVRQALQDVIQNIVGPASPAQTTKNSQ